MVIQVKEFNNRVLKLVVIRQTLFFIILIFTEMAYKFRRTSAVMQKRKVYFLRYPCFYILKLQINLISFLFFLLECIFDQFFAQTLIRRQSESMVNCTCINSAIVDFFLGCHPSSSNIARCQVPSGFRAWFLDSAGNIDFYQSANLNRLFYMKV